MTDLENGSNEGASINERLLFSSKTDNLSLFQEITSKDDSTFDINHQDGLGNTSLHYACQNVSINVLPEILELETDVDLKNKLKGDTPLHVAVGIEHKEARNWLVNQLLESGADPRERNLAGDKPFDLITGHSPEDEELRKELRKFEAQAGISSSDVVESADGVFFSRDEDEDDEDDGPPSDDE